MKKEQLDALLKLEQEATKGPWEYERNTDGYWRITEDGPLGYILADGSDSPHEDINPADRPLMVVARNALPRLLAEREKLLTALRLFVGEGGKQGSGPMDTWVEWDYQRLPWAALRDAVAFAEEDATHGT